MKHLTTVKFIKVILAVCMAITVLSFMNALPIMTSEETDGANIIPFNWKTCQKFVVYCIDNDIYYMHI
jgi:hypothetical protein